MNKSGPLPPDLSTPRARAGRFVVIHDFDDLAKDQLPEGLRGVARIGHLSKLLESAWMRFVEWDANRFAGEAKKAEGIRAELQIRLEFLDLAASLLRESLSVADSKIQDGIRATVTRLLLNLANGWDYFCCSENDVTLGSPDLYLKDYGSSLDSFEKRKSTYLRYLKSLNAARKTAEGQEKALEHAKADIDARRDAQGDPGVPPRL